VIQNDIAPKVAKFYMNFLDKKSFCQYPQHFQILVAWVAEPHCTVLWTILLAQLINPANQVKCCTVRISVNMAA
jgi:hypothetical protein